MSDVGGLGAPNAPCAIVPLNPNELSRESLDAVVREITSTGIWNGFDDTIEDRCEFSLHENKMSDNIYVKDTRGRTRATAHSQPRPMPSAGPPPATLGPQPRPPAPGGPRSTSATCTGSLHYHDMSACTTPASRRPPAMTQNPGEKNK